MLYGQDECPIFIIYSLFILYGFLLFVQYSMFICLIVYARAFFIHSQLVITVRLRKGI